MPTRGLFITATDTGVGKTYVAALAARALVRAGKSVGAYKPACSGAVRDSAGGLVWEDAEELESAVGNRFESQRVCPQRFEAPLAPPIAARLQGKQVDPRLLRSGARWWEDQVDHLLIEGVGGLLCPLSDDETVADLAVDLGYPLLIVARLGLGTINHTLLTVEAARARNLAIAGIVLNESTPVDDPSAESNEREIAERTSVPVLGVIRYGSNTVLRDRQPVTIDWHTLTAVPNRSKSASV
ncbi:MAG: dethiobiotin synthase [Planctomycetaceae bacterium]